MPSGYYSHSLQQMTQVSGMASSPQSHSHAPKSSLNLMKTKTNFCGETRRLTSSSVNPFAKMMLVASSGLNLSPIRKCSLAPVAPVEAVLFDIDGTMIDSDSIHFRAFQQLLLEVGYNGGVPITEEFYVKDVCGKHNDVLGPYLFPDWDVRKSRQFLDKKEALFKKLAVKEMKMVDGLDRMFKWIKSRGLKHAAVTNAPRPSADFLLSMTGLGDFFGTVVIGIEWGRPKPFPDPYLKGLELLRVSHRRAFVFEDSIAGIKAGVAAGMPVVGVALRNPPELLLEAGAAFTIKDYNDPKLWVALAEVDKITADAKMTVAAA
uniref:Haloacid dehalogenase-like hydrolase domain-containing protein Sgpp n=1 Tax=Kalanchoe fedtschenkoi TaxID=63787 RepID=A0A7N0TIR3_KALFE